MRFERKWTRRSALRSIGAAGLGLGSGAAFAAETLSGKRATEFALVGDDSHNLDYIRSAQRLAGLESGPDFRIESHKSAGEKRFARRREVGHAHRQSNLRRAQTFERLELENIFTGNWQGPYGGHQGVYVWRARRPKYPPVIAAGTIEMYPMASNL